MDKVIRRFDVQPILTIQATSISAGIGWMNATAEDSFFSYHGVETSLSVTHECTQSTRTSFGFKHRRTQYSGIYNGWLDRRVEATNTIHTSLTHEINQHWALDASLNWSENRSNTKLFDYERYTAGLKIVFNF